MESRVPNEFLNLEFIAIQACHGWSFHAVLLATTVLVGVLYLSAQSWPGAPVLLCVSNEEITLKQTR